MGAEGLHGLSYAIRFSYLLKISSLWSNLFQQILNYSISKTMKTNQQQLNYEN